MGRRPRRRQTGRTLHPGPQGRPRDGPQHQRGLPDAQRLDAAGAGLRRTSTGAGVAPRRRVHQRLQQHLQLDAADDARRRGGGDRQLPPRRTGFPGPSRAGCRPGRRQLRLGRSAGSAALGARQHFRVRRRPRQGDHRRRIRRRDVGVRPSRRARFGRSLPRRHHRQRAVPGAGRAARGHRRQPGLRAGRGVRRSGGRSGLSAQSAGR